MLHMDVQGSVICDALRMQITQMWASVLMDK